MYKILVVEDDATIAAAIVQHIQSWGFTAHCVGNFRQVLTEFVQFSPQLVLLDISLPFFNGYHWCDEIRKVSKVPIIFISSASENMNIVMAVSAGGDDFVAKPFDLSVLMAKIQALLRRTYDYAGQTDLIGYGGVLLDTGDCIVTCGDRSIELSKNENRILATLLEHGGSLVSRETLMARLWESDAFVDENTLSVNVARLRKKLAEIGVHDLIQTKKGMGYMAV